MASTKKPKISESSILESSKIKTTEELIHECDNFLRDISSEEQAIDMEVENTKLIYATNIINQPEVIETFSKRLENEVKLRDEVIKNILKKHKKKYGNKAQLNEMLYTDLLIIYNKEKRSILSTIRKMFNF